MFRVLIVEDSLDDAELVQLELTNAGYFVNSLRVATAADFSNALAGHDWDVIIADYTLPGFGAVEALKLLKQSERDIPFIIVSGNISDEAAVSAMRAGAHDYVLKDTIARLVPAIERELKEASSRRQKREVDAAVRYLSAIVESSDDAIIGKTLDAVVISWNRGAERLYGYTAQEMVGRSMSILLPPERHNELSDILHRLARGEHIAQYETVRMRRDGTLVDVAVKISPIFDNAGSITGASSIARDITERKRAEQALKATEQRYRTLFESIDEGFCVVKVIFDANDKPIDYRFLETSLSFEKQTGLVDACGKMMRELAPDYEEHWFEIYGRIAKTGEPARFQNKAAALNRWYDVYAFRYGEPENRQVAILFNDITEQKRTQKELEDSKNELQFALQAADAGSWSWRVGSDHFFLGEESQRLLFMPEHATLRDAFEPIVPEDQAQIEAELRACAEGLREYAVEFRVRSPQGVVRWIEAKGRLLEKDGVPWIYGINHDITHRKATEQALRESEERFRAVAENVPQMLWAANAEGHFLYLSPKWLEYTGTSPEQNEQEAWAEAVHPEDRPGSLEAWRKALSTNGKYEAEYRLRRHDDTYRWHVARAVPVRDSRDNVVYWFGTTTDVHDQKRAQEALIRSEKLASVGRMAATVAHEINNPLASAINALFLASTDCSVSQTVRQRIEVAQAELERVAHMTKQTLGFYRETGKPTAVNLSHVVDSTLALYGPKLRNKSISVQRKFRNSTLTHGSEGELRQIVSNLVANSIDAVNEYGTLHVRTSESDIDRRMVRLTIADNGVGISPENLKQIFEPFFTTKESVGTGLGLWVTKQLVEKHRGRIRARSQVGRGTVLTISLPADRRGEVREEEKLALDLAEQQKWNEMLGVTTRTT